MAALAAAPAPPISQLGVGGQTVSVRESSELSSCQFNRILPDPTSQHLVVWDLSRNLGDDLTLASHTFVVADLPSDRADDGELRRIATIGTLVRVEPLRWSETGERLLFRIGDDGAGLLDPAGRTLAAAPDLDPLWAEVRIAAISHGDLDFYRNPATLALLRRIEREGTPVRARATIGPTSAAFLILRYGNRRILTAYHGTRRWQTGVPISFAWAPLLPPGARRPLFMGGQTGYRSFLPYAMPLIDLASGRIAGRFGWERVELRGGRTIDLAAQFHQLINILDAAANGDTIFALVDLEREQRLVRIRGGEIRSWPLCEKRGIRAGPRVIAPPMNALPAEAPVVRSEIRFTPVTDPAEPGPFGHLYRPLNADGRLIVHFHGGPTATLAEKTVPQEVSTFAPRGISVLDVEYSGMLGGGLSLSRRLPRLGLRALRQDVEAVTRWVRRSGFRRVYILADSFGGAPGVIAALDHPDDYAHIFFRAPFLALRDPEQSVRRPRLLSTPAPPPASQLEFEQMVYGGARGRLRLGAQLQTYVQRLRPSPRLSFYFGGIDAVSAVTDLPPAFAGDPSVMIVPRTAHEFIAADWGVRDDIFAKIDAAPQ